ncbi:class I SAM-dependent methyltransferase [Piscinibacter gummiphilus]|uniref:Methyltransferase type 11 n=1 Tax=Piscinibacter gummiphilus TaxID=946333 RepID=A0A1W6LAH3_9BURK|nr:methyltransferase domain-containing protein [Piscinibacter gummiphilus]ARN21291.1 methyltransferase type 11 [Piscinibacter gummiphilus]ATU65977.1 methyltransferase domain-containing protein [Piscinibacter gummiphilus]GLS93859.1 hypothetical protein GCM10007918_11500 [Piscinibacter gummiphilus]
MTQVVGIISLAEWLETPPGRYLLAWEQAQLDRSVADVFGFHALQLGLPELDALRDNRMPHRWLATDQPPHRGGDTVESPPGGEVPDEETRRGYSRAQVVLQCDFDALPFDSQSLDLIVLPHALELARDPHLALREVERVLMPEGKAVILGFNPRSLWGVRQRCGQLWRQMGFKPRAGLFLPSGGDFIGYRRMRDWLRLLSFEVEAARFGCYAPPLRSERWLQRFDWAERVGERWWPVFGAVYLVVAVKRVRGMRLVGLARQQRQAAKAARAVVSHRQSRE